MQIPTEFLQHMEGVPGWNPDAFCKVLDSGQQVQSLRLNPAKLDTITALDFETAGPVPWSSQGYYLPQRPAYTLDPLLHAGGYYVQEASSMFLEQALKQHVTDFSGIRVLDLCAAPGGKSTHILSLLPESSVLVSNEVIKTRVHILEENSLKWGAVNQLITNNDPRDFSRHPGVFDVILIDAPCSGSGLFRRDPKAIDEWSENLVELCNQRQQRILVDAWPCLKENGLLIYSTCSYSVQENETMADWILSEFEAVSLSILRDADWKVKETQSDVHSAYGYRFFPDQVKGEGFFLAAFRKSGDGKKTGKTAKAKQKPARPPKQVLEMIPHWVDAGHMEMEYIELQDNIIGLPRAVAEVMADLPSIYIRRAGLTIGKWAGKNIVPDHAIALSGLLTAEVPAIELELSKAISYLRKDELSFSGYPTGWTSMNYKGLGLGWMKILPNRTNNYYPKEWRILMKSER